MVLTEAKDLKVWTVRSDRQVVDTEWPRRLESESSVVAGIAEHHDQPKPLLAQLAKELGHEGRTNSLALKIGSYRKRGNSRYGLTVEPSK